MPPRWSRASPWRKIDGAPCAASRLELNRPLGSGSAAPLAKVSLDDRLVDLTGAQDARVLPDRHPPPLPGLDDVRVSLMDEGARARQRLAAPVGQSGGCARQSAATGGAGPPAAGASLVKNPIRWSILLSKSSSLSRRPSQGRVIGLVQSASGARGAESWAL